MPDLTIESFQMCSSIDGPITTNIRLYFQTSLFSERYYPVCTCKAYQYGKREVNFGGIMYPLPCKHIKLAESQVCGWHGQHNVEVGQDENQYDNMICPKCGKKTVWVQVAV